MTASPEPAAIPQVEPGPCTADPPPLNLADLCFLCCIERTELGETWMVRTPGGKQHLCQFLPPTDEETTAALLGRLQSFRHHSLVPWMAVRGAGNRLALLSPLEGPTLADRFQELWTAKQPGVPREELLGYMRSAAVALDLLQSRHRIQHLWLHPRQLVIPDNRVQILGFGLVETWWAPTERPTGDLNPRYSAPELVRKIRGPQCDQYSLALIYAEMLTGLHPWRGREVAAAPRDADLGLLPEKDRAVIERALSHDPRKRYASATDMVEALEEPARLVNPSTALQPLLPSRPAIFQLSPCNTLDQFVTELVSLSAGRAKTPDELRIRFTLEPGRHLQVPRFLGKAQDTLPIFDDFCRQWHAKATLQENGLVILAINAAPSVWHWLLGRRLGLEIRVQFLPVAWGTHQAEVVIKPFGCDHQQAGRLLQQLGPKLLTSVRELLHAQPDQRGGERVAVRQRLRVCPVVNGEPARAIDCFTKDISAGGIGFFLPVELAASQIYVNLPELGTIAPYSALAQVVRKQPTPNGWFEVGAVFPGISDVKF
jgi:hypothetical protein